MGDDASTLQPKRMVNGGKIIIFESIDAISDFEVESEVQKLGGSGCKNNERTHVERENDVPLMKKYEDVSRTDAAYYLKKYPSAESEIEPDLFSYFKRAQDPLSLPDKCNDKCSAIMNRLRNSKDRCDRTTQVLQCMEESGERDCMRDDFIKSIRCDN